MQPLLKEFVNGDVRNYVHVLFRQSRHPNTGVSPMRYLRTAALSPEFSSAAVHNSMVNVRN